MAEIATREENGRLTVALSGDWTLMTLTSLSTSLASLGMRLREFAAQCLPFLLKDASCL